MISHAPPQLGHSTLKPKLSSSLICDRFIMRVTGIESSLPWYLTIFTGSSTTPLVKARFSLTIAAFFSLFASVRRLSSSIRGDVSNSTFCLHSGQPSPNLAEAGAAIPMIEKNPVATALRRDTASERCFTVLRSPFGASAEAPEAAHRAKTAARIGKK